MASFADYTEFVEPLRLPYRGKVYEIPPVGIQDTVRLHLGLEAAAAATADEEHDPAHHLTDDEFDRLLLGGALEQMRADNVPPDFVQRVLKTAAADFRSGRDFAEMIWATDGRPKAMADWAQTHQGFEPSTGTGEESSTPSPAPGSGTKTSPSKRPPSSPKTKPAAASRRGASSSPSGRSSKRTSTPSTASTSTPQDPSGE